VQSTSKERDSESGLDYFGARYMSSAQGRFTSPDDPFNDQDPSDPQSWNLYSYVRNNPLINVDPTGEDCVATSGQTDNSITVSVARGGEEKSCTKSGGTFVNGTVDVGSIKYYGTSLDFGYSGPNGEAGAFSKNLSPAPDALSPDVASALHTAGTRAGRDISTSAIIIGGLAAGVGSTYAAPVAIDAFSAYRAMAAWQAAVAVLKALPKDQYRLVQQWVGQIKPGNPIPPVPPGLSPDALQKYLNVAETYLAKGGPGVEVQELRIAAIKAALNK
jgi:RHS repeat-associated protein